MLAFAASGGSGVVTQVFVQFAHAEGAAAKEHGEPVRVGLASGGPCPARDHSLRVGLDDEGFVLQEIEADEHPIT